MSSDLGLLRAIEDDELELILSWRNAPTVRQNMYTRHEISLEEHLAWWHRVRGRQDQHYFLYEHDGQPLGVVSFTQVHAKDANASWAFYASPEAPRGTGSRMEFLALEHAFGGLMLHKLYCEVLAFNEPVINLHKKFGFSVEGILREQHRVDDTYVDVIRLGILHPEWEAMRDTLYRKLSSKQ
ncbi:UDP-4-amino-4,6-dideoxy-N-acetyl-beta-L-altrosamine N-acetyltransferase [Vreelandella zhuhanensis]|uniref:UDP-4-amino-4, 6-dideoxy-N-acetyl-beta-L-altrosamine N-acetyltransferase n=1 Tax=Vreelandella zhuhanensis TaxID=2684210 RepID=UPI0019248EFC|nr:UDP-4-amino-4,6-dideoxy-N-acetyl-beta-L-altrosamine N-acetyltransferase [Halomonas zhuhanensis]